MQKFIVFSIAILSLTAPQFTLASTQGKRTITITASQELSAVDLLRLSEKLKNSYESMNGKSLGRLGNLTSVNCEIQQVISVACEMLYQTEPSLSHNKLLTSKVSYLDYLIGEEIFSISVSLVAKK
jgi:hypothetical protein